MTDEAQRDTQERKRARHAYEALQNMRGRPKVCTRVQGLPIEVRAQGLTVAVATLLKEDRAESRELARLLASWVLGDKAHIVVDPPSNPTGAQLLERATTSVRSEYLAMQTEALAYLEHVKRLASALEKSEKSA